MIDTIKNLPWERIARIIAALYGAHWIILCAFGIGGAIYGVVFGADYDVGAYWLWLCWYALWTLGTVFVMALAAVAIGGFIALAEWATE